MKKIVLNTILLFAPFLVSADSRCPDYCSDGTFYTGRTFNIRAGECSEPTNREKCAYGCDGREKCLEGKDCPAKCEGGVYSYRGSFSAAKKDCQYTEKKCEYGCSNQECTPAPLIRKCDDYCKSGTFYSTGIYNTLLKKCDYKNKEKCVCDSVEEKCVDVDCSSRCSEGIAYFNGSATADGKCKYEKNEKCENGCDNDEIDCLGVCRSRCFNGNYYSNGSYHNAGAGKMTCVFEETICPAGCDSDSGGCKQCQSDDQCKGKNYCKDGSRIMGWCTTNKLSPQVQEVLDPQFFDYGCSYSLIGACPSGACNPLDSAMCGIVIGAVVFEDPADGKIKTIPGAKVVAVWKTLNEEITLPERETDENGNINLADEEKYKFFNDKNASLTITVTLDKFFPAIESVPSLTNVVKVNDTTTYKVNFIFGSLSGENKENFAKYFQNWENNKEKISVQSVPEPEKDNNTGIINWLKEWFGVIGKIFE